MPFALAAHADEARRLANVLRRTADLLEALSGLTPTARNKGRTHPELRQIAVRFERINEILDKGARAGAISAAQQRSIARNLTAIAEAVEKGAGTSR